MSDLFVMSVDGVSYLGTGYDKETGTLKETTKMRYDDFVKNLRYRAREGMRGLFRDIVFIGDVGITMTPLTEGEAEKWAAVQADMVVAERTAVPNAIIAEFGLK